MSDPVYVAHVLMVCPAQARDNAALVAAELSRNPEDAAPEFFGRPLESIETGEVTHYMAASLATQLTIDRLPALEGLFPGAAWTLWRIAGERTPLVDIETWLGSVGLRFVPDPPEEL